MQLTQANYQQFRDQIDWSRMPAALTDKPKIVTDSAAAKGWADMGEQTQKATEQFFKLCNILIAKDPTLLLNSSGADSQKHSEQHTDLPAPPSRPPAPASKPMRTRAKTEKKPRAASGKLVTALPKSIPAPAQVSAFASHTTFIKRYVQMHGKTRTRDQIVSLLHSLQKAITEQRIKKGNPALREVQRMQSELIALASKMDGLAKIEIAEPYLTHYRQIAEGEEVRTSVKLLKQFIQMNGKAPDKTKAEKLGKKMAVAYDEIPTEDIYRDELAAGAEAIADYVSGTTKTIGIPEASLHGLGSVAVGVGVSGLGAVSGSESAVIHLLRAKKVADLSDGSLKKAFSRTATPGLCLEIAKHLMQRGELTMGILKGVAAKKNNATLAGVADCTLLSSGRLTDLDILDLRLSNSRASGNVAGLGSVGDAVQPRPAYRPEAQLINAVGNTSAPETVSARDLAKMRFKTIGYSGRFKDVVGDPAVGFHMMVYGKPYNGKSSFVIELCKDLATLGKGRIAYLALEEGISLSMQKKVIDRGADKVDGLEFLGAMPESFEGYSFIVIDSVSDRSISREKLRDMFLMNPKTCFICIFHATKAGSARGGLDYSHDMDIILKIENHKPFVEKNRFL